LKYYYLYQQVNLRDFSKGDVIWFDCKTVKGDEQILGIILWIEAKKIYESCDLKNFKERIFNVPLYEDLDEHIFYTPHASYKE